MADDGRWLDRVERMARTGGTRHGSPRSAEPAPHERYLWDTGFHWGEWLVPGEEIGDLGALVAADKGDVATAYYAYSAGLMARIAGCSAAPRTPPATPSHGEHVRATPGGRSTSTPTAGSTRTRRPTTSARSRSSSCPTSCARPSPTGWSS